MSQPKVSIIIVTYLEENQRYLDLCLDSIQNLDYENKEVILCSSGTYIPTFPDGLIKIHSHENEQRHYPESINRGVELADPDSKYYFILNDDTILTKDSLTNLVSMAANHDGIFQPISTCDNYWRYFLEFSTSVNNKYIGLNRRFYRYKDYPKEVWQSIKNSASFYPPGIINQEWVALYATLIPKTTWQKVGTLDPNYKTGQDDIDYCKRAKKLNIGSFICLSSFVFHFGGVTADIALTPEIRSFNINYYKQKWDGESPI